MNTMVPQWSGARRGSSSSEGQDTTPPGSPPPDLDEPTSGQGMLDGNISSSSELDLPGKPILESSSSSEGESEIENPPPRRTFSPVEEDSDSESEVEQPEATREGSFTLSSDNEEDQSRQRSILFELEDAKEETVVEAKKESPLLAFIKSGKWKKSIWSPYTPVLATFTLQLLCFIAVIYLFFLRYLLEDGVYLYWAIIPHTFGLLAMFLYLPFVVYTLLIRKRIYIAFVVLEIVCTAIYEFFGLIMYIEFLSYLLVEGDGSISFIFDITFTGFLEVFLGFSFIIHFGIGVVDLGAVFFALFFERVDTSISLVLLGEGEDKPLKSGRI